MTTAALTSNTKNTKASESTAAPVQSTRETVESIVVAFILAFLFRAFVAEAFVIPTGSMAPTLMGAHRDIFCEHCGAQFQASASQEFVPETGKRNGKIVLGSMCSNCRGLNKYDFRGNPDHTVFSGDRILVSKFDYVLSSPKRWDVFVFKYYDKAQMNYIKRLVGLPGESLRVQEGDVYTQTDADWQIARKPPHKIQAMRRVVSDTQFQSAVLLKNKWPGGWQPSGNASNWQTDASDAGWSAKLSSTADADMLRYYHKVPSVTAWEAMLKGQSIEVPDAKASQLITDYLAYNATVGDRDVYDRYNGAAYRDRVYTTPVGPVLREQVTEELMAYDLVEREVGRRLAEGVSNQGTHWVGDLIAEFNLKVGSETGTLILDLVEFGVRYQCEIDVATGQAVLSATGESVGGIFEGEATTSGQCKLTGSGEYHIEFANVDDQIVLWVNGSVVEFNRSTAFDSRQFRSGAERRPYWTPEDPLDAAPIGIGGQGLELTVQRARVYRDIYYIAVQSADYSDFDFGKSGSIINCVVDPALRRGISATEAIEQVYSHPAWWADTELFDLRGVREFRLEEKQYFPMGDNSAASSDARAWRGHNYIEERFLLGKALLVFWPHTWNSPVPYTPNFARMSLIR